MEYIRTADQKPLRWVGAAYRELTSFPAQARRQAGHELGNLRQGVRPEDWKPMERVGPGACETRVQTWDGGVVQHRVVYVAKFAEAIYVLHAFARKTGQTSPHNVQVAKARYREMITSREALTSTKRRRPCPLNM